MLLWQQRVPFSPDTAAAVVDPVFGRDIGFFLFELPFLRLVQAVFNGIVVATLILVLIRYVVAATRGSLVFATPVRVHLAVLGGLFLLSVAFGYQLDKYELVYSTRGVATGVSFTDQNAQFLAFDVLTVLSGLAAALLVGGAFTRMLWPLGLVVGVWLIASIVVGRLYPEAVQRFSVAPNQYAQEQRYIQNNIAMTRLAFDLEDWEDRSFRGEAVLDQALIDADEDTFRNARLWDYRPLEATLDQLQTIRRYYQFVDVDTDRYVINDVQRQVMLSARELALERNPDIAGFVNQRITYTHGIGAAMVPVNEVANEGQPRLFIGNLPPVSTSGAPADHRAPHLLRRARLGLGHHRSPPERVRLPDRRGRGHGRRGHVHALDGHDRHQARHDAHAPALRRCASATWTCSSATRSRPRASCSCIASWPTGCRASRRSCSTTRTRTWSSARTAG